MSKTDRLWITASLTAAFLAAAGLSTTFAAEGVVRITDKSSPSQIQQVTNCSPAPAPGVVPDVCGCRQGYSADAGSQSGAANGVPCSCRNGHSAGCPTAGNGMCPPAGSGIGPMAGSGMCPHGAGIFSGMFGTAGGTCPPGFHGGLGGGLGRNVWGHGCLRGQCPFGCRGGLARLFPNLVPGGYCTYAPGHGWAPPVKVPVERVPVGYQRYYPSQWFGVPNAAAEPNATAPMIGTPTDTTQLGYYYQRVPTWYPAPYRIPHPNPNQIHTRHCPSGCPCQFSQAGYIIEESPTAEPTPAAPTEAEPPPAPIEPGKSAMARPVPAIR